MIEKVIVEDVGVVSSKSALEEYMKSMLFTKFLNLKLKQLPSDVSESEAQRALLPHVAKFWPKVFFTCLRTVGFVVCSVKVGYRRTESL